MKSSRAEKIAYWIATLIMFALMAVAIVTYHVKHDDIVKVFEGLGYPTYVIYPLAFLKLVALLVIASNRYRNLKDIAYGAYFIDMIMAMAAHIQHGDNAVHTFVGAAAVIVSYVLSNRVRGVPDRDAFLLPVRSA